MSHPIDSMTFDPGLGQGAGAVHESRASSFVTTSRDVATGIINRYANSPGERIMSHPAKTIKNGFDGDGALHRFHTLKRGGNPSVETQRVETSAFTLELIPTTSPIRVRASCHRRRSLF